MKAQLNIRASRYLASRDVIVPPTSNAVGLVQEVFPIAQRRFGVLVDGNDDRLDSTNLRAELTAEPRPEL
jgi:hypothetical protein